MEGTGAGVMMSGMMRGADLAALDDEVEGWKRRGCMKGTGARVMMSGNMQGADIAAPDDEVEG